MKLNTNTDSLKYIKISYRDNDDFKHVTKAVIKDINNIDIYACIKYEEQLHIKTPQEVDISIASENGIYRANTTLKSINFQDKYIFFYLKNPNEFDFEQNREYFRVKLNENAIVSYVYNEDTKQISCETYDISANGVRLVLDKRLPFPDIVQIKIFLPQKTITTEAKPIRFDKDDNINKASFSFTDIKEADLDYISQICLQKQLENRRNSIR